MKLKHVPTKQYGTFIKEYKPTGKQLRTMIRLDENGRIYCAPSIEFTTI